MSPCCCKCSVPNSTICLGRCDLLKHHCLTRKESSKKKPVPNHMGWLYTAKDAPEHQLRCGWRPGHILCPVLRKIEKHNCVKDGCSIPSTGGSQCPPQTSCCHVPRCIQIACPSPPICDPTPCPDYTKPVIRIARHGGKYTITTEPAGTKNSPSSEYPLKYVLNNDDKAPDDAIFSIEAKYNDYQFDYTASNHSFVIDFSPPEPKCRPCRPCRPCKPSRSCKPCRPCRPCPPCKPCKPCYVECAPAKSVVSRSYC